MTIATLPHQLQCFQFSLWPRWHWAQTIASHKQTNNREKHSERNEQINNKRPIISPFSIWLDGNKNELIDLLLCFMQKKCVYAELRLYILAVNFYAISLSLITTYKLHGIMYFAHELIPLRTKPGAQTHRQKLRFSLRSSSSLPHCGVHNRILLRWESGTCVSFYKFLALWISV